LRDYGVHFHELNGQIAELRDQIAAAKTDKTIAEKLQADTEKEVQIRQTHIDQTLKSELAEAKEELAIIAAHRDNLKQNLDAVVKKVKQTLALNKRLLAQWTEMQLGAARRLNELIEREASASAAPYTGE
ncbi:MAG TPA: hypothetical protein VFE62_11360, partial [Gemmataceae bacterium]|nr:hypothetical protein [Gemmataceae bacterium]